MKRSITKEQLTAASEWVEKELADQRWSSANPSHYVGQKILERVDPTAPHVVEPTTLEGFGWIRVKATIFLLGGDSYDVEIDIPKIDYASLPFFNEPIKEYAPPKKRGRGKGIAVKK